MAISRLPLSINSTMQIRWPLNPLDSTVDDLPQIDTGVRDGVPTAERERIKALERENKELRQANEILRLASAFFAQAELDRLKRK